MTALLEAFENDRDRGLVERHQAGDPAAFAELYALHFGRLIRFCRRQVRDPYLAEEIAQDAFVRALKAMESFGGERRFYPWLTVIARRLIIDHVRHNGRVRPTPNLDPGQAVPADELVEQRMDSDDLLIALERVRGRHREILQLRDWEGLSYDAIAERLGLPATTIPPLLHRARAALRREFMAITQGRVAALLPLAPLIASFRRMRDRYLLSFNTLPDPSAFAAPAAGLVIVLGSWLGSSTLTPGAAQIDPRSKTVMMTSSTAGSGILTANPSSLGTATADSAAPPGSSHSPTGTFLDPGMPALGVQDEAGARRARDRAREEPVHVEVGPFFFGTDPEDLPEDVQRTGRGISP